MNLINKKTLFAVAATVTVSAQANTLTGYIWENDSNDPTFANVPALGTASAKFSAPSGPLSFNTTDSNSIYTLSSWLGSGGATLVSASASKAGDTMNNTLFYFQGNVTLTHGATYSITHDDGVSFSVGGSLVINAPTPTVAHTDSFTWSGSNGTYFFQLAYSETHGAPGTLSTSSNLSLVGVPDNGSTLGLLGLGLVGVVALRRRN